ncbi:MAG TPA: cytidylate kinase family protein [Candidatus Acidoferrum sp.]|nr:cytidylate kinase family protein [Candidatus Acidoferrum sp.]
MSIIAISRGTFSGGEAVAKGVAARLGYRCVSREVMFEAAWGYGVPADDLMTAMEKPPPFWERLAGKRTAYLVCMRAALCEYARGGNLVYHGYLGHRHLPGIGHVLRVRVIADKEYRIRAAMAAQHLWRHEAIAYIEKVDKERRQWTRFLFDVDWDDPSLYDLVLNLERLSLATACDTVVHLAAQAEFQPTAASLKAMRDLALSSQVAAVLAQDPRTANASLEVVADDGIVTVTGTAQSPTVMEAVPLVARGVEGVKEVRGAVRYLPEGIEAP